MNGGTVIRVVAAVLLVGVLGVLGVSLYNAGVAAGINQSVVQSGQPVPIAPYYGYGPYWHGGFGFFGILFWIIGILLIFALIRAAFGWGRRGRGGWGRWGDGPGSYGRGDFGQSGRGGLGPRGEQAAAWHRELHRREESGFDSNAEGKPPTAGT